MLLAVIYWLTDMYFESCHASHQNSFGLLGILGGWEFTVQFYACSQFCNVIESKSLDSSVAACLVTLSGLSYLKMLTRLLYWIMSLLQFHLN